MPTTPGSASGGAPATTHEEEVEQHEQEVEDKEAYEYWGFMFKNDKTGTERLKALLRGLKDVMVRTKYCRHAQGVSADVCGIE